MIIHWNFKSLCRPFNNLMDEWISAILLLDSESNFAIDSIAAGESLNITPTERSNST
jgi:hypothetical protein